MSTGSHGSARRRSAAPTLVVSLLVLVILLAAKPAYAKTFTVTSKFDSPDVAPGDGVCDASPSQFVILCTLRAAIEEANDFSGVDAIHFGIPDSGVQTIVPNTKLPKVDERVTIDGYTQPGSEKNTIANGATNARPLIELDGTSAGPNADGLFLDGGAPNSVIRGLVINRFEDNGIRLGGQKSTIEGNFIGTDPTGTLDRGNDHNGVLVQSVNDTIGGTSPAASNLISGNGETGIVFGIGFDSAHKVQGNLVGTDKSASADLGNTSHGVFITKFDVRASLSNNTIGGSAPASNTIAFNDGDGVRVDEGFGEPSVNNGVTFNSIFSNGGLGIDLVGGSEDPAGHTANDPKDPDTGPNNLQNKPVLTSATTSGMKTTIEGGLNSKPNRGFIVQFFSNPRGDEGKRFLGEKSIFTNASGNASFSFLVPKLTVPDGQNVTATATGREGTSELSAPKTVT